MKTLLNALMRAIARVAASEAGELLSVRRKAHLLQAEMYTRLDASENPQAKAAAPAVVSASRCPSMPRNVRMTAAKLAR